MTLIGHPLSALILACKGSQATVAGTLAGCVMPSTRHLGALVTALHDWLACHPSFHPPQREDGKSTGKSKPQVPSRAKELPLVALLAKATAREASRP